MIQAGATRRVTYRDVLANREFRALYIAMALSFVGDQLARIAVALLVFSRTHSTLLTGLSYAVTYLPWIIGGPLLSGYADTRPRRSVLITCDVVRAVLVLAAAAPGLPTATLLILVTVVSTLESPFISARAALIPDILEDEDEYAVAATLGNATNQLGVVAGFAFGGAAVAAFGSHITLVLDALTFAVSAAVIVKNVKSRPAARTASIGSRSSDLWQGARLVFGRADLRYLVLVSWAVVAATVAVEAVAVPYAAHHHGGPTQAGLLTAAVPLGVAVGAFLLARFPADFGEAAIGPMAMVSPALLSLTFLDPPPVIAFALWFTAGFASAAVLTANRVFVLRVSKDRRAQAFGIAVAGLNGMQGLATFVVGTIASRTGPATALTDISLPLFAVIVILLVTHPRFSQTGDAPMLDVTRNQDNPHIEDNEVAARAIAGERRVWLLSAVLAAACAAVLLAAEGAEASIDIHLPSWWIFVLFLIGLSYPIAFKYRKQTITVSLESVPVLLGIIFIRPFDLLLLCAAASVLSDGVLRRQPVIRTTFNALSRLLATGASIAVFRALQVHGGTVHGSTWAALILAVIANEITSNVLVALVLVALEGRWRPLRNTRILLLIIPASTVASLLTITTADALLYDRDTLWAITIFVTMAVTGVRAYHRVAGRAAALDRLHHVVRELGPMAADATDLAPALQQLRRLMNTDIVELVVLSTADPDFVTVITATTDPASGDLITSTEMRSQDAPANVSSTVKEDPWPWFPRPTRVARQDQLAAQLVVGQKSVGVLCTRGPARAFESADLTLLEAAADQFANALEKGRLVDSLRRAAERDALTELANLESLRLFLSTMLQTGSGGVLLLFDIDRFHEVNDMLGHDAGDAVLVEVARRLESSPSHGSLSARLGSDQFALAIPGAAGSEVARLAAMAVKSRVDGSLRFADVSADVRVTIGIARAPEHGTDAATLLRRAEMAMTAAKGSSSGIGEWEPSYERDGSRRLHLLAGLRTALADGSLRVEYQPKIRLGSGDVIGFEALVRWRHPDLGPVSPAEFVPLAEATGLIAALTSTVLRDALTTCRTWHDAGKHVGIAVNISARSLDDPVLVGQVAAMLTASGLEPHWLTLEITESSVMENHTRSIEVLRQLRMLGVRLSIDDFGTGYSSLHQLRGLPVHEVKIDRSFVETVDTDGADRAVVKAVVELCTSLGLTAVAEGVETAAQAYALESLGVNQVQGYFHGRPMAPSAAMEWLLPRHAAPHPVVAQGTPEQRTRG